MRIKVEVKIEDRNLLQCEKCEAIPDFEVLTLNRVVTEEKDVEWRALDIHQFTDGWVEVSYVNQSAVAKKMLCPVCAAERTLPELLND